MDSAEIRRIRGSLTRAAFAQLLGVTPLTVLRWELPADSKEARRPRPKMIEALRQLAASGVGQTEPATADAEREEEDDDATEPIEPVATGGVERAPKTPPSSGELKLLQPLLEQLCGEDWRRAETELTALLSSEALATPAGRTLATLGLVQAQVLAYMDLRGALAVLVPILDAASRGELEPTLAARAHVMATLVFAAPDSRVHDLGRVNAHAARADRLLTPGQDDLRILSATSCLAAARYLGPEVTLHAYKAQLPYLERGRSALGRMLADALSGLVATVRGDAQASAEFGGRALAAAERMGHWGLVMGILSDYAHRTLRGSQPPEAVLDIATHGRECARAASLAPTEGFIRLLAAECEALCRLGRFDDAHRTATEALALAERQGLARYSLTAPLARLHLLTDRVTELAELAAYYERESTGLQQNATRIHAEYLRGLLSGLDGNFAAAAELFEHASGAPEATPGLEYVVHSAHYEAAVSRIMAGDLEGARRALDRFDSLLEVRPSVWQSMLARHGEALLAAQRGQLAEAQSRLESATATAALLGDVVQTKLEEASRDMLAVAAGAPDAPARVEATFEELRKLGVSTALVERRNRPFSKPPSGRWREPSTAEKLVIASERLGVKGLEPDDFRRELRAVLEFVFPGREPLVGGSQLAEVQTTVEASSQGEALRLGLRGAVDAEQRAFLLLLAGIVSQRPAAPTLPIDPELDIDGALPEFIAVARATRRLKRDIMRLSRSSATILLTGESGSGKEVAARAVHDVSPRAREAYVTFNCASVPRDLFESQLFGHKKGAFTGASTDSPGVIRAADGGTLFLDEIGELPLDVQPKLLRFLENGEVLTLGEVKPRRVNVRVVAATHRDLDRLVREGSFREDLYYRLNVVPIRVPPLRERLEDVPVLARLFLARLSEPGTPPPVLGQSALRALKAHTWPGNVRELRNVIERTMAYAPVPTELAAEHLRLPQG